MHALQVAGAQFADVRESLDYGTPEARNLIDREVCLGSKPEVKQGSRERPLLGEERKSIRGPKANLLFP